MKKIYFFLAMAIASLSVNGQVYQTDFGNAASGSAPPNPFQPAPVSINANISYGASGGWTGGTIFYGGTSGAAYVIGTNSGNGSFVLTLTIGSGYKLDVTAISCQARRTASGPTGVAMAVNGTSFTVSGTPGNGSFAAVTASGTANNLTGTFTVTITTSGGSGASQNIRLDDFSLNGTITAVSSGTSAATDYFRSAASGGWTSNSSWESSADGATNWITATLTPTSAANAITIRDGHTIAISSTGLSLDQTVIEAGGQLNIDAGVTFTLADGAGTDLEVRGTFLNAGGSHTWTGKMALESGGTYIHNTTASAADAYNAASMISPTSTWVYRGSSSLAVNTVFAGRTYGHLWFQSSSGMLNIYPDMDAYDTCFTNDFFIDTEVTLNGGNVLSAFKIGGHFTNDGDIFNLFSSFNVVFTGVEKTINTPPTIEFVPNRVVFAEGSSYTLYGDISPLSGNNPNDPNEPDRLIVEEGAVLNARAFRINGSGTVRIDGTLITAHSTSVFGSFLYRIKLGPASTIHYNSSINEQAFLSRNDYANVEISGGTDKILKGNTKLSGILTLTNGKVILGPNNLEVGTSVTGGSSSNYVVTDSTGALTIDNIGSTVKTFPVGPSTSLYHPATISNSGTVDDFSVKVSSTDLPCMQAAKAVKATWDISEATAGGSDCAITLDYTGATTGSSYYPLSGKIIHCNGTTKDYSNGSVTGTVATGSGFTSFSPFGVAVDDEGGSLPVKFANVKAVEQGSGTFISWSNLTETDVKDYTVEYSANGNNFMAIGSVNARSNNDGREDYSFLHNNVLSTVSYYRIRSEEFSGLINYSIVVKVDRRKGQTLVSVYPNPSSGSDIVMQATDLSKGRYTMTIYAANGQQVATQTLNHNGGSVTTPVLIPSTLKAGVYTLLLRSTETKITSRFVVR